MTTVARQGSLLDGQFLKYSGLASLISATATDNLSRPIRDKDPIYLTSHYRDPATSPPERRNLPTWTSWRDC